MLTTEGLPQQHVCMEEDVSAEQLLCNKETSSSRDQGELRSPPWIKQEEEDYCSSQEEEERELKEETNGYLLNPCEEDFLQHCVCMEEEAPADQLLCDQERNSSQVQEEPDLLQIKEEQEEYYSCLEEGQPDPQEETNGFMPTPSCEEGESSASEQYTGLSDQIQPHTFFIPQEEFYEGSEDADAGLFKNAELMPETRRYFPPLSEADSEVDAAKKPFKCGFCGKTFQFKSKLIRHVATHMRKSKFTCGICKKSFGQNCQLIHHMRIHMSGGKMLTQHGGLLSHAEVKRFVCNTCGKRFSKPYILKRHARLHTGEKPFTCGTCGKSFSRRDHMLGHMRSHPGESASVCGDLDKPCIPPVPLIKLTAVHAAKKLYSCEKCGKHFTRHRSFLYHMKSHRGGSSFVCKTCGKHFNQSSRLKRHESVHTGVKPFSCSTCGKSVSRRDHLLRHMRLHTDRSAYV
ncbi:uncharacterized protein FYW61_001028 isoform 2-T3 [Anableps anableps]